ncbi:NUDIX domain-containing protein [Streptomyces chartreusis]|uniref:NUDIX hydrolase n=1 Tax=Streptomyces chartreusis TaxID=1969 RepID=UPI0036BC0501
MGGQYIRFPVAVHLLLFSNDQILLTRRYNTGYCDGLYGVVAGHLEGQEDITRATCREAAEEIGVSIFPSELSLVGVMHRLSDEERIEFFLTGQSWRGKITNNEPTKCDDVRWFNVRSLPHETIPYIRRAITLTINRELPQLWFEEPDFARPRT